MKTTIAILLLLACSVGLGGAYVFTPKQVAVTDHNLIVQKRQAVEFSKHYPYCQPYQALTLKYVGEEPAYIAEIGQVVSFSQDPKMYSGGCFGPSFILFEPGMEMTCKVDPAHPIECIYQKVENFYGPREHMVYHDTVRVPIHLNP